MVVVYRLFGLLRNMTDILLLCFMLASLTNLPHMCNDIIHGNQDVKWETIKGLDNAKRLLKEAVVMPIKYPK